MLQFWQTQGGQLNASTQRDTYLFNAVAGDNIRVGAVENGAPITLSLVDISGTVITSGESIETRIATNGLYRVVVQMSADTPTSYTLGLSYTDRPDPNAPTPLAIAVGIPTPTLDVGDRGTFVSSVQANIPINGALTAREPRQVYTIALQQGQFFTLEMSRVSGTIDPYLALFDPVGNLLAEDDNAGGNRSARLLNIRAMRSGDYQVQVSARDTFGEYALLFRSDFQTPTSDPLPTVAPILVTPYATPTLGALVPGESRLSDHVPTQGVIESDSAIQQFSFIANAGDLVTVGIAPFGNSGLRPSADIYDPEGVLVASVRSSTSNDSGNAYLPALRINTGGAHLLIVSGEDNSKGGFTVSYGIGTSRINNFKGLAAAEVRLTSTLAPKGVRDTWAVTLLAGDVITVAVSSADGGMSPAVDLTTLDGIPLASDNNAAASPNALIRSITVNQTGQYLIRVRASRGDQIGSYLLVWRYINLVGTATPAPNQTALLNISDTLPPTEYRFYRFYGLKGQTVNISLVPRSGSNLDGIAVLLDENGSEIAQGDDDNGLNPNFMATLPNDGTYTVRVNGYLTDGNFELVVKWLYG